MVHKGISTYSNKGDYYADQGHSVIASTDGNNYVYVGGQFLYTTCKAQYTKEEFGSALADPGWPVERVYWNGQPVNVVEYNGVAYYANRKATDGTIIGADANKDVSTINRVAIAVDHGGESSSFSGGAEYAGENLSLFRKVMTKVRLDFGHVSLVFFNNTGDSPEELNFGRYGKDPGITHSSDKLLESILNQQGDNEMVVGEELGIPFRYQGTYVVDSSSYDPATDYKNTYILNISKEGAQDVARKVNNQILESGYTYRSTEVWITPKRKGDVAYRLNGDTSSYDLLHNNCATVTINAIKEALGNSDIIVNKDNIAELLSLMRPAAVENILEEDYKTYHGEGIVKEIQRGKR